MSKKLKIPAKVFQELVEAVNTRGRKVAVGKVLVRYRGRPYSKHLVASVKVLLLLRECARKKKRKK